MHSFYRYVNHISLFFSLPLLFFFSFFNLQSSIILLFPSFPFPSLLLLLIFYYSALLPASLNTFPLQKLFFFLFFLSFSFSFSFKPSFTHLIFFKTNLFFFFCSKTSFPLSSKIRINNLSWLNQLFSDQSIDRSIDDRSRIPKQKG